MTLEVAPIVVSSASYAQNVKPCDLSIQAFLEEQNAHVEGEVVWGSGVVLSQLLAINGFIYYYKAPRKVFLVRRAGAVVAYNFGSVPPCHPTANIDAERPTLTQTKTLQARGPWQQPRHPKFGHWIITKLYISVVLIWDKRINPQGTHDFPATNQIEELQGRCIPTSMGSWRPRLRASKAKNSWKIGPFWCGWFGGFQKWWYSTTIGFPTTNDHFGVFWGYHHLRKHPFIYKHKKLTFDMDQQKSSAKSDVRIKRPPTPAKWDTKKTFSTSALKVLWEHPRKRNNFGKVAWKLWEPQHQAYLSHMFLYVLSNGAYSL